MRRRSDARVPVSPSRFAFRDIVVEATAGVLQRPMRSALTTLGTVLGIGSFIAILGLTATANSQIGKRFSTLDATRVTVLDVAPHRGDATPSFPRDADARAEQVNGVVHAGVTWPVRLARPEVRTLPTARSGLRLDVYAASPGAVLAAEAPLVTGRRYDDFHERRGEAVCVLGSVAARQLGITELDAVTAVFVGDRAFNVIGILGPSERAPHLALSVLVPTSTALRQFGPPSPDDPARMDVQTRLGAAQVVARQLAVALRPDAPKSFRAVAPPDPRTLRENVTSDLDALFLVLAGICLVIGAVGIANTTLVAILERTSEIGLRRAVGACRRHIAVQFLAESAALGTIGGLVGASLGVVTVLAVAVVKEWTPVIPPQSLWPAPFAGALVGIVAGLYPALRAASVEPAESLRH